MKYALHVGLLGALLIAACTGPAGPEGPQGQQGPQGSQGPAGPTGPAGTFSGTFNGNVTLTGDVTVGGGLTVDGGVTASIFPVGMVVAYAASTPPPGWLICDGAAVSRTQYAGLFAVIGVTHGAGDLVNTFNVPDYRGRFLRGVDRGAARDPDRGARTAMNTGGNAGDNIGSVQGGQFTSHNHGVNDPGHAHTAPTSTGTSGGYEVALTAYGYDYVGGAPTSPSTTGISIQANGGNETRPVNANVNFIIKY